MVESVSRFRTEATMTVPVGDPDERTRDLRIMPDLGEGRHLDGRAAVRFRAPGRHAHLELELERVAVEAAAGVRLSFGWTSGRVSPALPARGTLTSVGRAIAVKSNAPAANSLVASVIDAAGRR